MREPFEARQGDIYLIEVSHIPNHAHRVIRDGGAVSVAEGEVTGHHHRVVGDIAEYATTADHVEQWLCIGTGGAVLTHPEHDRTHGPIVIPPGITVEVVRQRQYSPESIRYVAD